MINHLSIGVRDIARTKNFYDSVLQPLGYSCLSSGDGYLGYGAGSVVLWIYQSDNPVPADPKSGLHFCFDAPTRASVDAFHAAALKAQGSDNGKPGIRADYDPTYYAGFVLDPDGYRLEAYCSK